MNIGGLRSGTVSVNMLIAKSMLHCYYDLHV